uniref:Uncharacterized protein n=1 Tax=Acrobeloides nanus TaxID=290746 RepID=A0A914E543_9BILA
MLALTEDVRVGLHAIPPSVTITASSVNAAVEVVIYFIARRPIIHVHVILVNFVLKRLAMLSAKLQASDVTMVIVI